MYWVELLTLVLNQAIKVKGSGWASEKLVMLAKSVVPFRRIALPTTPLTKVGLPTSVPPLLPDPSSVREVPETLFGSKVQELYRLSVGARRYRILRLAAVLGCQPSTMISAVARTSAVVMIDLRDIFL